MYTYEIRTSYPKIPAEFQFLFLTTRLALHLESVKNGNNVSPSTKMQYDNRTIISIVCDPLPRNDWGILILDNPSLPKWDFPSNFQSPRFFGEMLYPPTVVLPKTHFSTPFSGERALVAVF